VHAGATLEFIFPDAGFLLELNTIAACMIGGASLMGGTVIGACLSTLLMDATLPIETRVSNILSLMTVKETSPIWIPFLRFRDWRFTVRAM
jgi:ABC-type xylose transport system permease subunit